MVSDTENDSALLDYVLEDGTVLEFCFFPASDEGFAQVAMIMMASIQAA